eukprot:1375659-Lingulodinium_polyedra.AAC.1
MSELQVHCLHHKLALAHFKEERQHDGVPVGQYQAMPPISKVLPPMNYRKTSERNNLHASGLVNAQRNKPCN